MSDQMEKDEALQADIERFKKVTGLRDKEETLAGIFEEGVMKYASLETDELMQMLMEAAGEDAPDMEALMQEIKDI